MRNPFERPVAVEQMTGPQRRYLEDLLVKRGTIKGIEPEKIREALVEFLTKVDKRKASTLIDRVKAETLLALSAELNAAFPFVQTFMISAEKGYGCDQLRDWLAGTLPESPWLYPEDQIADLPMRMIAAEITREKLTLRLHEEIPYQLTVETEAWEERKDGSARMDQVVYVARPGHKGIVLGKGGETIKAVGQAARAELEEFMGRRVHLFLQVKVRENWLDEAERYNEMGLDFRDGDA